MKGALHKLTDFSCKIQLNFNIESANKAEWIRKQSVTPKLKGFFDVRRLHFKRGVLAL